MRRLLEIAALGVVQGAAELLPVSSSAHIAAFARLLKWDSSKELEVALHAGAALALAPEFLKLLPDAKTLAMSLLPPVVIGFVFEERLERLGPEVGLLVGGAALVLADLSGSRDRKGQASCVGRGMRWKGLSLSARQESPDLEPLRLGPAGTGLVLGAAQAVALVPGVSRSGATLAAARALGHSRRDASRLSFGVAGPVLVGATALKAWRARRAVDPQLLVGVVTSFLAARAAVKLIGLERTEPWWPYSAERLALAVALVRYGRAR